VWKAVENTGHPSHTSMSDKLSKAQWDETLQRMGHKNIYSPSFSDTPSWMKSCKLCRILLSHTCTEAVIWINFHSMIGKSLRSCLLWFSASLVCWSVSRDQFSVLEEWRGKWWNVSLQNTAGDTAPKSLRSLPYVKAANQKRLFNLAF
jgi:hypothetical protein